MRFSRPGSGTILGGIALFVALGGTALAATGNLVNIADPTDATKVANVDSPGKLRVGDGSGNLTVDGTVTSHVAGPSAFWRASGTATSSCTSIATPPAGKAVVLTSITINVYSAPSGTLGGGRFIPIYNNNSCSGSPIWDITPTQLGDTTTHFDPGVGIPSSGALSVQDFSSSGYGIEVFANGYTVTASTVPSTAAPANPVDSGPHSGPPASR